MSVNIEVLRGMIKDCEFKLIGGHGGTTNIIRWVHMVENVEIASFIKGGEMVFITGVGLANDQSLFELVQAVSNRGACGVVINVGPYIHQIPQQIINYCDREKVPLFEVPWHVHMAEIMKKLCLVITESQKVQENLASALKHIIFNNIQDKAVFEVLEGYGFKYNMDYIVSIIEFEGIDNDLVLLRDKIHNFLIRRHTELITVETHNKLLLLYGKCDEQKVREELEQLVQWYRVTMGDSKITSIGIGQQVKSLKGISKSYEEANKCLKFHSLAQEKQLILLYSNLGIYKLVLAIENESVINEFYEETLMPLVQYDKSKGSDLVLVLQYYIESSGSVKNVAEKMFLHRNTINYKLRRIEEILECDLSSWDTRLLLNMALILNKIH